MVQKLWSFKDFSRSLSMLSATANAAKSIQNYQNLPKFAQRWNFEIPRIEEALEHISTVRIFNPRIFHMLFLLSKNGLCMWILAYPLVEINDFLKVPHLVWAWYFVDTLILYNLPCFQEGLFWGNFGLNAASGV
jgi:hypothetical protein